MPVLSVPKSTAFALREWTVIADTPAILLCHRCIWHNYCSCLASIMHLLGWTTGPWSVYCSWMRKLRSQEGRCHLLKGTKWVRSRAMPSTWDYCLYMQSSFQHQGWILEYCLQTFTVSKPGKIHSFIHSLSTKNHLKPAMVLASLNTSQ